MNKTALIHPSDVKIELIMFYEVINAKNIQTQYRHRGSCNVTL